MARDDLQCLVTGDWGEQLQGGTSSTQASASSSSAVIRRRGRPQLRAGPVRGAPAGRDQRSCKAACLGSCPVSLIVKHGERFYLRCLKYVRQAVP
jgi:hypothetical protein